MNFKKLFLITYLIIFLPSISSQLRIEIKGGIEESISIAVVPMQWNLEIPQEIFIHKVIKSDLEEDGDMDVFRKVRKDFDEKGISITDDELRQSMDQFLLQAKEEIIGKDNI